MNENLVYNPNAVVEVTKEFTFDSCHHLENYKGACANLHGHTYKLQVTLRGTVDTIGMLVDFKTVKAVVKSLVVDKLDHKNLNEKLPFNTTAENMVVYIFDVLNNNVFEEGVKVSSVKLWETPTSYAEYKGVKRA